MLWGGGGSSDSADSSRLSQFKAIKQAPQYMLGFEEPDCAAGGGSAGMSVSDGVSIWEEYIAPFKAKGTKLGSPSMCSTPSLISCRSLLTDYLRASRRDLAQAVL